ncbi:GNAT family N-acetyltransferase [Actinomadura madurae]|uniref:GNAT family N-acetyltransferase n=1 Tax=Actinomadura madurae TaxID=1993 RepID=UPI0020D25F1B|nr:GNAT family protein [Actinomadura madurae]MCP9947552.1 GNAT family N-acetyltransferase [Actinomadura madurae]MCP9964319.1 GNAT family N-acetyltransferase [Actinomadura madurae]MCP9976807.1 GNAT family N-acetyltransferase [Actinomadura madurae]MCQ0011713.1 GNAT family N-acetyltransferase [Actinomadura madurae]MCQ0012984.1 GNAT family N-acetyltransferase [Actinomadura madurae]
MTDEVELRPVAEDDLAVIERLRTDPRLAGEFLWQGWHDPRRYRRRWEDNRMLGEDLGNLAVVRGGRLLGIVSYRKIAYMEQSWFWSVGISLLPDARGHGAGSRAQRLLVEYLFAHTAVHRIQAEVEVDNIAEQRALEKAGFTREGVMRGVGFRGGEHRDEVLYSILRTDLAPSPNGGPNGGPGSGRA